MSDPSLEKTWHALKKDTLCQVCVEINPVFLSLVEIESVVLKKKTKTWTVNDNDDDGQWTYFDQKITGKGTDKHLEVHRMTNLNTRLKLYRTCSLNCKTTEWFNQVSLFDIFRHPQELLSEGDAITASECHTRQSWSWSKMGYFDC